MPSALPPLITEFCTVTPESPDPSATRIRQQFIVCHPPASVLLWVLFVSKMFDLLKFKRYIHAPSNLEFWNVRLAIVEPFTWFSPVNVTLSKVSPFVPDLTWRFMLAPCPVTDRIVTRGLLTIPLNVCVP